MNTGDIMQKRARGPRRRGRAALWMILSLGFAGLTGGAAVLAATHLRVPVPDWIVAQLEARANAALAGRMTLSVAGGAGIAIDRDFALRVDLQSARLLRPSGLPIAAAPEITAAFLPADLLAGRIAPVEVTLQGAAATLRRRSDDSFDIDFGAQGGDALAGLQMKDMARASDAVEALFSVPSLSALRRVTAEGLRVRVQDDRLGRAWQMSQGDLTLTQDAERIAATLSFDIGESGELPAQAALTASTSRRGPEAEFAAAVTDVSSRDLALQSPALALLGLLDAPISGSLRTGVNADGSFKRLDATLKLGEGALSPVAGAAPVPFQGASVTMDYDPATQKVAISEAELRSRALRLKASGQIYLQDFQDGMPRAALAQAQMTDVQADPQGVFEQPARFDFGAVDMRLRADPFRVEIGQMQLVNADTRISGSGEASAAADGWRVAFDAGIGRIGRGDLLALWPPMLVPPTRRWIEENVATGELRDVHAAVRLAPGTEPKFELGYEFQDAEATILRTLPPVTEGRGFATIFQNSHALMIEKGAIGAPEGGAVDVSDSAMIVPDIREKPALARVRLMTRSTIPAALSLLDEPPFEFMKKAGKTPDLATGWAEGRTDLSFRMEQKIDPKDVDYHVAATLRDVRSDKLVPGRVMTSPALSLTADRTGMRIAGRGMLGQAAFDGAWSQGFAPEERDHSRLDGYAQITPEGLDSLGVRLPAGMLAGSGWGRIGVEMRKGDPARYDFETDLRGLSLSLPDIAWSKPGAAAGDLTVSGALTHPATVDHFALTAPGLEAAGRMTLTTAGFGRAEMDRLRIGDWFSGRATVISAGQGAPPDVVTRGGRLDLRRLPDFGAARKTGGGGAAAAAKGAGGRITGRLDEVRLTDALALTQFQARLATRGGVQGEFSGRVNGSATVTGGLTPAAGGRPAIRLSAEDAGWVAASMGLTDRAAGGRLALNLTPVGRKSYDGALTVSGLRVTDAPTLATVLSALSVVGLVQQLNGEGLVFDTVDAAFRLTPDGVSITRAAAEGASMAVTVAGNILTKTGHLDLEGVVSPFYILNSVGQLISRHGEGLFGVNYTLRGAVKSPSVGINPLSLLTPGALRDLFRRAPAPLPVE